MVQKLSTADWTFQQKLDYYLSAMRYNNWVKSHHRIARKFGKDAAWEIESYCLSTGLMKRNSGKVILTEKGRRKS